MLSPFYVGENNILKYEQEYYADLGINILAYEKGKIGYRQLEEVIKHWKKEINQVTGYLGGVESVEPHQAEFERQHANRDQTSRPA